MYQKLFNDKNNYFFEFEFYKFMGKLNKVRSLLLNWKGDLSFYDVTDHKDDFFNKIQILFLFFSGFKTALNVDRYL